MIPSYNDAGQMYQPQASTIVEPYMYQTLLSLIHYSVVLETNRGTMRGILTHVSPDHITIDVSGHCYFVRLQQINWVMPTTQSQVPK